jgi:hypothetical protein
MKKALAVSLAVLASAGFANTDKPRFGLKGYDIAQDIEKCPDATTQQSTDSMGVTTCTWPGDTLAGVPVAAMQLRILDKRVLGVGAALADRSNSGEVLNALRAKYGAPTDEKRHIQSYVWRRGDHVIMLDGLSGTVLVIDATLNNILTRERARKNTGDL